MANNNTIRSQISDVTTSPGLQNTFSQTGITYAAATSTETMFTLSAGPVTGLGGGVIPLSLGNPQNYAFSVGAQQTAATPPWGSRSIRVRAMGHSVAGAGMSLTIKIYQVTAAIIAAGTLTSTSFTGATNIATTGSQSVASVTTCFELTCDLQLSSTGRLTGRLQGHVDTTAVALVTLTNSPTGLLGEGDLNFFVTAAWSAGSSSGAVVLDEFSLEQI